VSTVLVIAGTDSSGGAGLTRDLATLTQLGVRATCAVTAVTAQSDRQFVARQLLPPELLRAQIIAALATRTPGAIKVGMLGDAALIAAVVAALPARGRIPLVLDPVLHSSSGGALLDEAARGELIGQLLPRVTLLTPNIPEAAALLGQPQATDEAGLLRQAQALLALGPQAILLKGGHGGGATVRDLLLIGGAAVRWLEGPRRPGARRGTGCALASAIAAQLAQGATLEAACAQGRAYVDTLWQSDP
jgi:hydroxymethylpyrimidine/phosphomethylpyrimidine kinase